MWRGIISSKYNSNGRPFLLHHVIRPRRVVGSTSSVDGRVFIWKKQQQQQQQQRCTICTLGGRRLVQRGDDTTTTTTTGAPWLRVSRFPTLSSSATTTAAADGVRRLVASGGGGAEKKRQAAMKRQKQKDKNPTTTGKTTYQPPPMTETNSSSGGSTSSSTSQQQQQQYLHRTIPDPTALIDPSSRFDRTPSFPTRLDLSESASFSSLDWQSSYASIHPLQQQPSLGFGPSSSSLSSQSRRSNLVADLTPPTPDGIMAQDLTSSLLDLKDLYNPQIHLPYAPQDWKGYESATPLSDELMAFIGVLGRPLTTADYMRQALTHPLYGYYTNPPSSALSKSLQEKPNSNKDNTNDDDDLDWDEPVTSLSSSPSSTSSSSSSSPSTLIGPKGDFVTAPEVSHVFGHCICLWFVTQWQTLHHPPSIELVELGPGRGTLMADIVQLATTEQLRTTFGQAIHTIHLIEASFDLRQEQQRKLHDTLGHLVNFNFDDRSDDDDDDVPSKTNEETETETETVGGDSGGDGNDTKLNIRVQWHDSFASFRNQDQDSTTKRPVFMVLQEFLDALPVHAFERTKDGWRERLIDVVDREENPPNPDHTPLVPRLRQVLAPDVTPAVELFFPEERSSSSSSSSPKSDGDTTAIDTSATATSPSTKGVDDGPPVGTVVEICPEAILLVQDMAKVIEDRGGVALMIDYGQEGTADTLRAFSNHQQVPLTSYPGQVDVTADVDFHVLKNAVQQQAGQQQKQARSTSSKSDDIVSAFGPVTQGEFLMRMGASDMVIALIEQESTTIEQANAFSQALKFLVLPEHMGECFKVLALGRKRDGIFAPPGMEK